MKTAYTEKELHKAFNRIKIQAISNNVFITTIGFHLKIQFTSSINTACTDGVYIKINPDFFMGLEEPIRLSLYLHEIYHVALMHSIRVGTRNRNKYNIAGDYVINLILKNNHNPIPNDWLYAIKYEGLSTEQVYNQLPDNMDPPMIPDLVDLEGSPGGDSKNDKEEQAKIENIVLKAVAASKMSTDSPGTIPGEVEVLLDKLINPILPWNTLLANFMSSLSNQDYSWNRPNSCYIHRRIYLPSLHSDSLGILTFAFDTSASVSEEMLVEMFSEIEYIHKTMRPEEMHIVLFDTKIKKIITLNPDDEVQDIIITGRGGTSIKWIPDYCDLHKPEALIVFSDMQCMPLQKNVDCPLLWICYGVEDDFKTEFGEVVIYKPEFAQ